MWELAKSVMGRFASAGVLIIALVLVLAISAIVRDLLYSDIEKLEGLHGAKSSELAMLEKSLADVESDLHVHRDRIGEWKQARVLMQRAKHAARKARETATQLRRDLERMGWWSAQWQKIREAFGDQQGLEEKWRELRRHEQHTAQFEEEKDRLESGLLELEGELSADYGEEWSALWDKDAERERLQRSAGVTRSEILELSAERDQKCDRLRWAEEILWEKVLWALPRALGIAAILILAPIANRLVRYYIVAPLITRAAPVRLETKQLSGVAVGATKVAQAIDLLPGQQALVKPEFDQASDDRLQKRTAVFFDASFPFTSLACGLAGMTRVTNTDEDMPRRLTVSNQDQPEIELAIIDLPPGSSIICRPSYIAGAVFEQGARPKIQSHWNFSSLHAWITMQFRYFEFCGPLRLVLWANRGVRAELMSAQGEEEPPRMRTNQDCTIGFTPSLEYSSVRAETFWSYFIGKNPLFDDAFTGNGTFICQQIATKSRAGRIMRFWETLWNGVLKLLGI